MPGASPMRVPVVACLSCTTEASYTRWREIVPKRLAGRKRAEQSARCMLGG